MKKLIFIVLFTILSFSIFYVLVLIHQDLQQLNEHLSYVRVGNAINNYLNKYY